MSHPRNLANNRIKFFSKPLISSTPEHKPEPLAIFINGYSLEEYKKITPTIKNAERFTRHAIDICLLLKLSEKEAYQVLLKNLPPTKTTGWICRSPLGKKLNSIQITLLNSFLRDETLTASFGSAYRIQERHKSTKKWILKEGDYEDLINMLKENLATVNSESNALDYYKSLFGKVFHPKTDKETVQDYLNNFENDPDYFIRFCEIFIKNDTFNTIGSFFEFLFSVIQMQSLQCQVTSDSLSERKECHSDLRIR